MFFKNLTLKINKYNNLIINYLGYIISAISKKNIIWGKPTFLSIEITSVCNLHCPQCALGQNKVHRSNKYINLNLYKKIIDESSPYIVNLILYFQGEPFMNPDIIEMIHYAHKKNVRLQTSTNAQLINNSLAKQIVESKLDRLIVSIDGTTQEIYEKYRVGGKLQKCIDAVKYINFWKNKLNSKFPKIELQMLVFKYNQDQIYDFKILAKKLNANFTSLKSAQIYDVQKNHDLAPTINKYSRYKKIEDNWVLKKKLKNKCYRMYSGSVITSDGELLPCCYDKNSKYSYGNVTNKKLTQVWKSKEAILFRKNILQNRKNIDICRNCNQ